VVEEHRALNPDKGGCIHHWLVDVCGLGFCKKCGSVQQFCSSWEEASRDAGWPRGNASLRRPAQDQKSVVEKDAPGRP